MLRIQTFVTNLLQENCYVVSDDSGEAVIVDCGAYFEDDYAALQAYIVREHLHPVRHLLTHGHFDHCFGAQWVEDTYGLKPEVSQADAETYYLQPRQIEQFLHRTFPLSLPPLGQTFMEGDVFRFGNGHTLNVLSVPGHTPGGVCFYEESEGVLFSGDSLFRASIGRADLPGSDPQALITTLKTKILTLPPQTRVFPGHGSETSIAFERLYNPYLSATP